MHHQHLDTQNADSATEAPRFTHCQQASKNASVFSFLNFLLAAFVFVGASAHAETTEAPSIVLAASGCGLGVHRGAFDGCYPLYGYPPAYFRGYRNDYYVGPINRGLCGGRGTHLQCNFYGICWVACNGRFAS